MGRISAPFFGVYSMNKYEAVEVINLHVGHVALDEDQARRRIHNIKEVKNGVYEIINPIQFKIGEKFGYEGEVNKALAQSLDSETKEKNRRKRDTQSEEETQDKESDVTYPVHLGGPWYKLSNGEKVQGKQDAEDAEYLLGE